MEKRLLLFTLLCCTRGGGEPSVTTEDVLSQNSVNCLDSPLTMRLLPFLPQIKATWENPNGQIQIKIDQPNQYGWICQKAKKSKNRETQFITMFDSANMLPVYSAYITAPWTMQNAQWTTQSFDRRKFENVGNPTMNVGKWGNILISNYESYTGSGLDRGHLFAAQYATTLDQNKATYRLTNTVAQDSDFNENQWNKAEQYMKETGFRKCQESGGTPFVFTGAVTGFQDQTYQITKPDSPNVVEMKIPTHLWTTMLCVDDNNNKISAHMSFIGSNYQKGLIIFYKNFLHFGADLKQMYNSENDLFVTPEYNGMNHENSQLLLVPTGISEDGFFLCQTQQEMIIYWKTVNVAEQRALTMFDRFSYFMRLSGYDVAHYKAYLVNTVNRKKRETPPSDSNDAKLSFMLVMINDTHTKHDLELSKFELTEVDEKTKMTADQYTVNLKKKEYIEENPGGTEVKLTYQEDDGKERAFARVQSTTRKLNIILTPRN